MSGLTDNPSMSDVFWTVEEGQQAEEVKALRFAVGSRHGPRSSTWRVWEDKKGDFYIAPGSELRAYRAKPEKKMRWLPPPPRERLVVASVYVLQPDAEGRKWPGAEQGSFPIGLAKAANRFLWLVGHEHQMDEEVLSWVKKNRRRLEDRSENALKAVGRRAIVAGQRPDNGRHWLMELAWQSVKEDAPRG